MNDAILSIKTLLNLQSISEKDFNLYSNLVIISFTAVVVYFLMKRNIKDLDDIDSYDWSKYSIAGETKGKSKKAETKEKPKQRVKEYSKGTGFIKEENRFPVLIDSKLGGDKFLTFEESNNFQDLINYAATMNKDKENSTYPIESLYSQVMGNPYTENNINANERIDSKINEVLQK